MNTGMLWFDNDPKVELSAKIERAAAYYRQKYGREPNLCLLHPSMMPGGGKVETEKPHKLKVRTYSPVLPGHLWIGVEEGN